jgi:diguanylate cyclase (GGDEF)-like protein
MDGNSPVNFSPNLLQVLESAPLFVGVARPLLADMLLTSRKILLKPEEILLAAEQPNNLLYVVLSGRLSIQLNDELGRDPIALFGEGECVGEMSILGNGFTSTYVIAATSCELLVVDRAALWTLIDESHEAAHNMLSILSQRILGRDRLLSENLEQHVGFSGLDMVDELTGLYNRHWLSKKLGRYLQRSLANGKPSFLIMLEMDFHQKYVEEYGVLGGDQALRTIAHTMLSSLRPDDQAGHYMGPQFIVFLPNTTSLADAARAAERLRIAVNEANVVLPNGDGLPKITISLGVSEALKENDLAGVLSRSLNALGEAQSSGGNCVNSVT